MAYQIGYNPDPGIIDIKYSGEISLEEILSVIEEAWELVQRHNSLLVISDFLDADIAFDLTRILEINEKFEALGVPRELRSAVLVPQDELANNNIQVRLYEISAGTNGWPARLFYSREQALQWLLY